MNTIKTEATSVCMHVCIEVCLTSCIGRWILSVVTKVFGYLVKSYELLITIEHFDCNNRVDVYLVAKLHEVNNPVALDNNRRKLVTNFIVTHLRN